MSTASLIAMQDIDSSLLKQIGHDAYSFILRARFLPGKKSPLGKVYHYKNVSEEVWDDVNNPKSGESIGQAFSRIIKGNPDKFPFECVDEGVDVDQSATSTSIAKQDAAPGTEIVAASVPDDVDEIKALALTTRTEATAITISTADECEIASREVLRIRTERKIAIGKINKIKEPAAQAWKAACALFNEVDSRYAEAEKFLDDGILAYRALVKRQEAERIAAENKRQAELAEHARQAQQEEFERQQKAAKDEADRTAAQLAQQDAAEAQARGASAEEVRGIIDNPLPVAVRHVAPPPIAYVAPPPASIEPLEIPKVAGLSYTTEWFYQITDESLIPLSHEYYSLDEKKINAKVQALKKHANIPGVSVDSREVPRKNTSRAK